MRTLGKLHRLEQNRVYAGEKSRPPHLNYFDECRAFKPVTEEQLQLKLQESFQRIAADAKQYFTNEIAKNPSADEGLTLYWQVPVTEVAWDKLRLHRSPTYALGYGGKSWLSLLEWADEAGYRLRVESSVRLDGTQVFIQLQTQPGSEDTEPACLPIDEAKVHSDFRESLIRVTEMVKREFTESIRANHVEEYFRRVESYVFRQEPAWNFLRFAKYGYVEDHDYPDGLSDVVRAIVEEVWTPFLTWLQDSDLKTFVGLNLWPEGDVWRLEAIYVDEVEDRPCIKPFH